MRVDGPDALPLSNTSVAAVDAINNACRRMPFKHADAKLTECSCLALCPFWFFARSGQVDLPMHTHVTQRW
jgi:hypothetical protein